MAGLGNQSESFGESALCSLWQNALASGDSHNLASSFPKLDHCERTAEEELITNSMEER